MKTLTLGFLVRDGAICLAMKKRGFGVGKWNGFGGKLEPGEMLVDAMVRELEEECDVRANVHDLELVAEFDFIYVDQGTMNVHAFLIRDWEGEPVETEEMRPQWFTHGEVPYADMWADDEHWLPRVLAGERLRGKVWFNEDGHTIREMEWPTLFVTR